MKLARSVWISRGMSFRRTAPMRVGRQLFSRGLTRGKVLEFFAAQPRCAVAPEACGGAHHWARELTILGHEVRLIPPAYVKPFIKRRKNDAADAKAICETMQRPNMRFVAIQSEEQQVSALVFRARGLLVRQGTQTLNAIRGHTAECGWVAPKGPAWVTKLGDLTAAITVAPLRGRRKLRSVVLDSPNFKDWSIIRSAALVTTCLAGMTMGITPLMAQDASEIARLRAELAALKANQQQTAQRIVSIERALVRIAGPETGPETSAPRRVGTSNSRQDAASTAQQMLPEGIASRFDVSGDVRVRYEANQGDADARNRHRGVVRARLRGTYAINDALTAGAQLSTGDDGDPNTADVTLGNFDDDLTVSLDQVYLRGKFGGLTLTGGKVPQPFRRTDLVWDGDVSPQGISAAYSIALPGGLTAKAAGLYFQIDESTFAADTSMTGAQAEFASSAGVVGFGVAVGYFDYRLRHLGGADSGDFRSNLLLPDGSYLSDFDLLDVIATVSFGGFGEHWPVTLVGDYVHNFGAEVDADTGFGGEVSVGRASRPGDWKFGYGYAQAEVDAVFAAFSHDNLGIATNYRLHTISIDYVPMPHTGLNLTWYRYRPLDALYSGSNDPTDWLHRIRLNLMVDF